MGCELGVISRRGARLPWQSVTGRAEMGASREGPHPRAGVEQCLSGGVSFHCRNREGLGCILEAGDSSEGLQ